MDRILPVSLGYAAILVAQSKAKQRKLSSTNLCEVVAGSAGVVRPERIGAGSSLGRRCLVRRDGPLFWSFRVENYDIEAVDARHGTNRWWDGIPPCSIAFWLSWETPLGLVDNQNLGIRCVQDMPDLANEVGAVLLPIPDEQCYWMLGK